VLVEGNSSMPVLLTAQGPATFERKAAARYSGGLFVSSSATVRFLSTAAFHSNVGQQSGGLQVGSPTSLVFGGDLDLVNNTANAGAGMYTYAPVSVAGRLTAVGNTALAGPAGGVYLNSAANLTVLGDALFDGNRVWGGGGLFMAGGTNLNAVRFAGAANFTGNVAGYTSGGSLLGASGGGVLCNDKGVLRLEGPALFRGNAAGANGGGLNVFCRLFVGTSLTVADNTAAVSGGGMIMSILSGNTNPWEVGSRPGDVPVTVNFTGNRANREFGAVHHLQQPLQHLAAVGTQQQQQQRDAAGV
jgi:hypothetical protein